VGDLLGEDKSPTGEDDTRYSLFSTLKRQAAPILGSTGGGGRPPAPRPTGTAAQEATIDKIMGRREQPFRERVRDGIRSYVDGGALELKQSFLDRFAAIEALEKETRGQVGHGARSAYKAARMTQNLHSVNLLDSLQLIERERFQCAVKPPSTGRATPSTKLAPGLQSQRTAAATSSDRPSRPIG
jgi:hypothetical protein